ncbi:arylsulfatase B-like isoform X1 [Mya arenaria]|uniref:arylsulfatase B-like isoform X1 n=1 Tax=Mya arenaria TaxID=6604 RepID=UPI0022E55F8B|nr:arylsulfatase B-like isoform X1 [Mya arenaria]XP_052803907.1 arylsulfatase B-like isoform X1 [Mya arenaria]XP_052803908.1 arylsulfatase B-like isoform X1 [Mya arenaria]XP_052803910.1 arylsulfatase B-like isoform X1 [Mya arenaria]XP_052803911.1 arylsulfatase B-like isoform X1 [Mya arenaria]
MWSCLGADQLKLLVSLAVLLVATGQEPSRPNIVLIVADDLGWNDVGFHGSEIKTPNIDRLAYDGVILNNYYVSPICTPTRGSLMTGRHPIHLGLQHYVISAPEPWGLPLNYTLMPQHFKRLGYATHIVGKWHLGFFKNEYLPTSRGFDSHFGYWTGKEDYFDHMDIDGFKGLDFRNNMAVVNDTFYSTEQYTKQAVNIIETHDMSKPLFLYLAHQAVHAGNSNDPVQAPSEYVDRFPYIENKKRRTFAGMAAALDDSIGEVVRILNHRGLMNNTIIVFSTDNGGPANNYDLNAACNFPLRGTKNTMWEGGLHGVGFIHSALLKHRHVKTDNMVHVSDWLPTLYSAAGGSIADLGDIDGLDLWDMMKKGGENVRHEILHNIDPVSKFSAIRVDGYKLIQGDISGHRNDGWYSCTPPTDYGNITQQVQEKYHHANNHSKERFTRNPYTPYVIDCGPRPNTTSDCDPYRKPCLFYIPTDPCEYNDVAEFNPAIVQSMLRRIDQYSATAVAPVNKPEDKNANPLFYGGVWSPWLD